jgi:hypothetical protein
MECWERKREAESPTMPPPTMKTGACWVCAMGEVVNVVTFRADTVDTAIVVTLRVATVGTPAVVKILKTHQCKRRGIPLADVAGNELLIHYGPIPGHSYLARACHASVDN